MPISGNALRDAIGSMIEAQTHLEPAAAAPAHHRADLLGIAFRAAQIRGHGRIRIIRFVPPSNELRGELRSQSTLDINIHAFIGQVELRRAGIPIPLPSSGSLAKYDCACIARLQSHKSMYRRRRSAEWALS